MRHLELLRGILMWKRPQLSLMWHIGFLGGSNLFRFQLLNIVPPAVLGCRSSCFLHDDRFRLRTVLQHRPLLSVLCQLGVRKRSLGEVIPGSRLHIPRLNRFLGGSSLFCFQLLNIVSPAVLGCRSSCFLHDDRFRLRTVLQHRPLLSVLCQLGVRKHSLREVVP